MGSGSGMGFYLLVGGIALGTAYMFNFFGIRDKINNKVHGDSDKIKQPGKGVDPASFDVVNRIGYTAAQTPGGYVVNVDPAKGRTVFNKAYFGKSYQAITVS